MRIQIREADVQKTTGTDTVWRYVEKMFNETTRLVRGVDPLKPWFANAENTFVFIIENYVYNGLDDWTYHVKIMRSTI